jgi:lambda repressor-like predicted transcriptional regulator
MTESKKDQRDWLTSERLLAELQKTGIDLRKVVTRGAGSSQQGVASKGIAQDDRIRKLLRGD